MKQYDLIVIGAGPAGADLALEAAARNWNVALLEKQRVGGTCLNRGCIPTKALLHLSELQAAQEKMAQEGMYDANRIEEQKKALGESVSLDYRDRIVSTQREGLEQAIKRSKNLDFYQAFGLVTSVGQVQLLEPQSTAGSESVPQTTAGSNVVLSPCPPPEYASLWPEDGLLASDVIVLACGSVPSVIPIPGVDLPGVYTSDDFLDGDFPRHAWENSQSIIIIGGGVIGVEMADFFAAGGRKVTIIEALDRLLPNMEIGLSRGLAQSFKKRGIEVLTKTKVSEISTVDSGLEVLYQEEKSEDSASLTCDAVLMAAGRRPNSQGLFLGDVQAEMQGRAISVDAFYETSLPGVYAIGDLRYGSPQLAHSASTDATRLFEVLAAKRRGEEPILPDYPAIPHCVYTQPELSEVGLTESAAKEAGISVFTGKANSLSNARSLISGGERGYVNVVFEVASRKLLGAQFMGDRATDLVDELALAINQGLTVENLAAQCYAHPSYAEIIGAAVRAAMAKNPL